MTVTIVPTVANTTPISTVAGRTGAVVVASADIADLLTANQLSAYGAGTVYTITNAAAAIVMGTTSPALTINKPGTYKIDFRARIENVGATFAATRLLTLKLNRTNNTPADLTNGTILFNTPVITLLTSTLCVLDGSVIYTTTNSDDAIVLSSLISVVPSAGSITVNEASIVATRLQQAGGA